jgi:HlyD family secretion protein
MELETTTTKPEGKFEFPICAPGLNQTLKGRTLSRKQLVIGFVVIAGAITGGAGFVFSKKAPVATQRKIPVVTVTVQKAEMRPMLRSIKVNGTIWPWDPLTIGSQVNGLSIQSILVDDGQIVKKGQVLARLDSSVLQAQLEQERARLENNQAALAKAIQPNRVEDILSLQAAVEQANATISQEKSGLIRAEANMNNALLNSRRYVDLARQGAVSAQDLGNRDTDAKLAEADVRSAEGRVRAAQFARAQAVQRLNMAKIGGRKEDVQMSRANVAASQATVKQLEAQIAQTVIRSPVDGLIMKRDAHLGDITSAGKSLFQIVRDNRLELRAQVSELELAKLHPGMQVDISGSANSHAVRATVREISPLVDQETRLGTVRIDVPASAGFKPGNFVRGDIKLGNSLALTVPSQAVLTKSDESFALVLNSENQAKSRIVKTGNRSADLVEIIDGLTPTDRVVVKGAGFVKDGDYVRVGVAE